MSVERLGHTLGSTCLLVPVGLVKRGWCSLLGRSTRSEVRGRVEGWECVRGRPITGGTGRYNAAKGTFIATGTPTSTRFAFHLVP
jgi:hypothetical protein